MNHGGKRPGAGRKPSGNVKVPLALRIAPELRDYLASTANQTETVETALRRSKGFREWAARHQSY